MFRYSLSLLVLMLFLNQLNLAASRSFEMVAKEDQNKKQKREGMIRFFALHISQITSPQRS